VLESLGILEWGAILANIRRFTHLNRSLVLCQVVNQIFLIIFNVWDCIKWGEMGRSGGEGRYVGF